MYVQQDTLQLTYIFDNFPNMQLEIYELDTAYCLSLSGLTGKAALKKTKVKLDLLADLDVLLMAEEGITGGICHANY